VYGLSLSASSPANTDALARTLDVAGLGASLMLRTDAAACAPSLLRGNGAALDDPHVPSAVDALGSLPFAALTTPPLPPPPPRHLPAPSHYSPSYTWPTLPTAYSAVAPESVAKYTTHVQAAGGRISTPPLDPYLAYVQAPLQVLDCLSR
jgi:hypothetical protein